MRTKNVTLTGSMPLLMHDDNVLSADKINEWRTNPENKKLSVAGDDRMPAWTWLSYVYHTGPIVGVKSDNLMKMLSEGGAKVALKGKETFKKITGPGLLVTEPIWEIRSKNGITANWNEIKKLQGEMAIDRHFEVAIKNGFNLFIKRARVGTKKHIRVRPIWSAGWTISGQITILDEIITDKKFEDILSMGGRYCGLCDWRPSSKDSGGMYGTFTVEVSNG